MKDYSESVNYILDIPKFAGKNTLEDTYALLTKLYHGKAKIVHVAGTNGKGSVTMYLSEILMQMGYKVGTFTSPHLVDITERISIQGKNISEEDFTKCFNDVYELVKKEGDEKHPSFFEYLFLMAMDYYAQNELDYIILETGLGGRLDATNCIKEKALSVITKIGYDHMEYLGDTLESIAFEKAGIIKENVPVVFFDNEDETSDVIVKAAKSKNSACYPIRKGSCQMNDCAKESIDFSIGCEYYRFGGLHLETIAEYQIYNASLAVMAAYILEKDLFTEDVVKQGLGKMYWPGRMEQIYQGVYLDGAHNTDGIEAFISSVKVRFLHDKADGTLFTRRRLMFAVAKDKEYPKMINMLVHSALFTDYYVCPLENQRRATTFMMRETFENYSPINVKYFENAEEAFHSVMTDKKADEEVFIVGSLYLVGQIKALLKEISYA